MRRLVVGVDGTDAATTALEWAADTVGPDGHLHAVVAVDPALEFVVDVVTGDTMNYLQAVYHDLATRWTSHVADRVGELTADLVERTAPKALASAAAEFDADAIVVGVHVTHLGLPARIGGTIRHLLRELEVPLIVVPDGCTRGVVDQPAPLDPLVEVDPLLPLGPLVVGVGHGSATEAAVRWAARLADDRDLDVVLIRATGDGPVFQTDGVLDLISYELHPSHRHERWEHDLVRLAEQVQHASENELEIDIVAVPGLAAAQLAEASDVASLLVIGQHRSKLLLGRHTSQPLRHLLTHARCPVAVVPERDDVPSGDDVYR